MKASELQDIILRKIIRQRGGTARHWRSVIGPIRIYDPETHAHCNWAVSPSGEPREILQVETMLDMLRLEHPIVEAG